MLILSCLLTPLFVQATSLPDVEKIDINSAPLEDLVKIIHIGEVRAKELIFLRPFFSLDDLDRIKGISEARIKDIKKQGLAWVGAETEIETPEKVENNFNEEKTKEAPAQNDKNFKKELAIAGERASEKTSFLPFFVAFLLAIFSGITILILKKNAEKVYNKNV